MAAVSPAAGNRAMELTWVAIAASLAMGLGAAAVFVFAVKRDYFRDLEDAKYQVFWSDIPDLVDISKEDAHGAGAQDSCGADPR